MDAKSNSAKPVLEVSDLRHDYGQRTILDGVNLSICSGERVALMGPSGSGKSTLLNCIAGIERPLLGDVKIVGESLRQATDVTLDLLRRKSIGLVFQFFHLLPTLTARENVILPLLLDGIRRAEAMERCESVLEEVGVSGRAEALPGQLSGGEQQRVALARALVTRPALILADEPTGNLDRRTGERILDLIERLSQTYQTALLMVTHDPETTRICDRTLYLLDGRLLDVPQPTTFAEYAGTH